MLSPRCVPARPAARTSSKGSTRVQRQPRPAWLSLDSRTGVLSGQPPGDADPIGQGMVTAQAEDGDGASTVVKLRVKR